MMPFGEKVIGDPVSSRNNTLGGGTLTCTIEAKSVFKKALGSGAASAAEQQKNKDAKTHKRNALEKDVIEKPSLSVLFMALFIPSKLLGPCRCRAEEPDNARLLSYNFYILKGLPLSSQIGRTLPLYGAKGCSAPHGIPPRELYKLHNFYNSPQE
jgi:hypothetical protein